jgi:hypothetical protein
MKGLHALTIILGRSLGSRVAIIYIFGFGVVLIIRIDPKEAQV